MKLLKNMTMLELKRTIREHNKIMEQIPDLSHIPAVTLEILAKEQYRKEQQRERARKHRRKK